MVACRRWMVALRLSAQERYAPFPAVGVELLQPDGFAVAKQFQGLENEDMGSGIVLLTFPVPPAQVVAGFTADRLKSQGMVLGKKTDTTIAGKPGVLLSVTQSQQGIEFGKWIAIFGDKTTTMINGSYPKQLEAEMEPVVKSIIVGARAIEAGRAPLGASVDFELR